MIDDASALLRGLSLAAGAIVAGSFFFLWLANSFRASVSAAGSSPHPLHLLQRRIISLAALTAALQLVAVSAWLLVQTVRIMPTEDLPTADDVAALTSDTRVGGVGLLRFLLVMGVLLATLICRHQHHRRHTIGITIDTRAAWPVLLPVLSLLAAVTAAISVVAGHSAGADNAWVAITLNGLHVSAAALWVGALPAWLIYARAAAAAVGEPTVRMAAAYVVQRFSRWALALVAILALTGVWLADAQIDNVGDLFATAYGQTLLVKLLLVVGILLLANGVRRHLLPRLLSVVDATADSKGAVFRLAARRVLIEAVLALGVLLLAARLAETTPAKHDTAVWPFAFRWSWDAAAADPATFPGLMVGVGFVVVAGILALAGALRWLLSRNRLPRWLRSVVGVLGVIGMGCLAWYAAIPAYPDTWRRSTIPYVTTSITHGAELFAAHCMQCHGSGGLGDGPLAASLPKPPADLGKPHTALHTAGDMFWWLGHGIPAGGMPGFAHVLTEEDRWDIVNFLRIFSQGYQARILTPEITPQTPWLGAPNFYLPANVENLDELRDLRDRQNVLIVVYDPQDVWSSARLRALAAAGKALRASGLTVIAVAGSGAVPAGVPESMPESAAADRLNGAPGKIPGQRFSGAENTDPADHPMVVLDGGVTARAYGFLARTLAVRGPENRLDPAQPHVEWLIDRFGYVRARWVPTEDASAWQDPAVLVRLSHQLWQEPALREPPGEHIH